MLAWMLAVNPMLASTAHAVDVEVRYLGYVQTYRLGPGELLHDTWYKVPLPEEQGRRRPREDRRPDVHVQVAVREVGEGAIAVEVKLDREHQGTRTAVAAPTLLVAEQEPVGRVEIGKRAALVDEEKSHGNRLRFRRLSRPEVEVTVVPEGFFTEEVMEPSPGG